MHFGYFNLMQQRDPKKRVRDSYGDSLTQVKLAEDLGFEIAWFAEHHFSTYSVCPSPLMTIAWMAGQTKRIKLAPGVLLLALYEPVRLIQEIGMADVMSDGRFVLGLGTGYQPYEFVRFKQNLKEGGDRYLEVLDMLEMALTEGEVEYKGKYYSVPHTRFAVSPLRRLPETYVAGVLNHPGIRKRTCESGYVPLLAPAWNPIALVEKQRADYLDVARSVGVKAEDFPFAIMRYVHVSDSKEDAAEAAEQFRYLTRVAVAFRFDYGTFNGVTPDDVPAKDEPPLADQVKNGIFGSPEHCAEIIVREIKTLNPVHYVINMQAGSLDPRKTMRSLERFGKDVMPLVRKALPNLDSIGGRPGPLRPGFTGHQVAAQ
jgi:alkanesulfonate monooxygenase SsuD/methylene tetrahydromethanopterin reductase-like flavin-dependent oxidoreductase (luciferase family)